MQPGPVSGIGPSRRSIRLVPTLVWPRRRIWSSPCGLWSSTPCLASHHRRWRPSSASGGNTCPKLVWRASPRRWWRMFLARTMPRRPRTIHISGLPRVTGLDTLGALCLAFSA
eukprot:4757953-Lingulodinium_polyedra.AAC.1